MEPLLEYEKSTEKLEETEKTVTKWMEEEDLKNSDVSVSFDNFITLSSSSTINELGKQLLLASKNGCIDKIKCLLAKGAAFTADWLGNSPLHHAVQNNHLDVVELLLRAGMSRDARTKVDKTPLHMAAFHGFTDIVQCLIQNGADLDAVDLLRMTPLHWAVQNCHGDVVGLLITAGCRLDIDNKFNLTPLDIANDLGRTDLIEMLTIGEGTQTLGDQSLNAKISETVGENSSADDTADQYINENSCDNSSNSIHSAPSIPIETILIEDMEMENGESFNDIEGGQMKMDRVLEQINVEDSSYTESMKLLQGHGISMLPCTNESSILATILESGHSMVLTDAGKDLLKSVKIDNEKSTPLSSEPKNKYFTLSSDEYVLFSNGALDKASIIQGLKRKIAPKPVKRIVMKKNKVIPVTNQISTMSFSALEKSDMETVMKQLIEARTYIEELKKIIISKDLELDVTKKQLLASSAEVQRYKQQLKFYMRTN